MADRQLGLAELLRKMFVYGSAIWLLRTSGVALTIAAVGVATALGAIEIVQRYLPGRTAEITDPLLALGIAYALSLAARTRASRRLE
jgi:VanZ family protein